MPKTLLILGGTNEASTLAAAAQEARSRDLRIINSLAGRVEEPAPLCGEMRIGGFGGAAALALYLAEQKVDALVDATHPFATRISAHAREACDAAGVPRLILSRPPWQRHSGDRWLEVETFENAAEALPWVGRRAFLTIGHKGLEAFSHLHGPEHPNMWFLLRLVSPPKTPLPLGEEGKDYAVIYDRGPFSAESERELMARHQINVLVSKMSGGKTTEGKIIAARLLKIPVVLIARPRPERGERVETVAEALAWVESTLYPVDNQSATRA